MPDLPPQPKPTTADGLRRARQAFLGDWDADGVTTTYLPTAIAEQALIDRGWHRAAPTRRGLGPWVSPTGDREWDTDYAFALALTAETLGSAGVEHGDADVSA